jgi:hypothetical protein
MNAAHATRSQSGFFGEPDFLADGNPAGKRDVSAARRHEYIAGVEIARMGKRIINRRFEINVLGPSSRGIVHYAQMFSID